VTVAVTRKLQAAQTSAELKQAALVVFERLGYLNAKITDITQEAGKAAGSFYTHFESKEALLEALLADLLNEVDQNIANSVGASGHSGDFANWSAVRWHVAAYWQTYRTYSAVLRSLQQAAIVNERFAARLQEMTEPDRRHFVEHLEQARAAGATLPGDPMLVAFMIQAAMLTFTSQWIDNGERGDLPADAGDDEGIDTLTNFIYAAIYGPSGHEVRR
jgi:AcrR family transcriptional regulator